MRALRGARCTWRLIITLVGLNDNRGDGFATGDKFSGSRREPACKKVIDGIS